MSRPRVITAIQEPLPLSAGTWGTWISEESALLCAREAHSHLLPGSLSWELTVGVSTREEKQGKLCSNEGRPWARPSTNAPPSQAGFGAHAVSPSQTWKRRLHQARWHSREMAEPTPGTGTRDTHVCVCGLCTPSVASDSKQSPGWSTQEAGQHPAPQTCCVGGPVSMRVGWLVPPGPTQEQRSPGICLPNEAWRVPPSRRKG